MVRVGLNPAKPSFPLLPLTTTTAHIHLLSTAPCPFSLLPSTPPAPTEPLPTKPPTNDQQLAHHLPTVAAPQTATLHPPTLALTLALALAPTTR